MLLLDSNTELTGSLWLEAQGHLQNVGPFSQQAATELAALPESTRRNNSHFHCWKCQVERYRFHCEWTFLYHHPSGVGSS